MFIVFVVDDLNAFPILYRLSFLLCSSPKRRTKSSKPTRFLGSLSSTEREQRFVQWRRTVFCLSNVPVSRRRRITSIISIERSTDGIDLGCYLNRGWTSLSRTGPGEGTLQVFPDVNLATSYLLLRPFFKPRRGRETQLGFDDWEVDLESTEFPGSVKGKGKISFNSCCSSTSLLVLKSSQENLRTRTFAPHSSTSRPRQHYDFYPSSPSRLSSILALRRRTLCRIPTQGFNGFLSSLHPCLSSHSHNREIPQTAKRWVCSRRASERLPSRSWREWVCRTSGREGCSDEGREESAWI